jgi:hypothetical protein
MHLWHSLEKYGATVWIVFIWLWIGTSVGFCKHDNEHLGSVNGGYYLLIS